MMNVCLSFQNFPNRFQSFLGLWHDSDWDPTVCMRRNCHADDMFKLSLQSHGTLISASCQSPIFGQAVTFEWGAWQSTETTK